MGFKATCLLLFPDSVGLGVGFTVPVQPNLRAVKCQHALTNHKASR